MMMMMCSDFVAAWSRDGDECACDAAVDINPDDASIWFEDDRAVYDRAALVGTDIPASSDAIVAAVAAAVVVALSISRATAADDEL